MGPEGSNTHVTTRVMGTYGYAAPEYVSTGQDIQELENANKLERKKIKKLMTYIIIIMTKIQAT